MDMRVSQNLILLPLFAQVLLSLAIMVVMGMRRGASLKAQGRSMQDVALAGDKDWSEGAVQASNNYKNQFEMPVLFFAVSAFALITRNVDAVMLALAAAFVATRIWHTIVHLGANQVSTRFVAFLSGVAVLLAMWVLLMARVAAQGF
jgi:hypothetical protein